MKNFMQARTDHFNRYSGLYKMAAYNFLGRGALAREIAVIRQMLWRVIYA